MCIWITLHDVVKCRNFAHGLCFAMGLLAIQIKICAEYRDMLPRPRLICQEPGLRPIGRSPGVPDKSSRGLGSMSRYSAQILICFIAYIFLNFFIPLWVWLGTLQDCQYAQCPLPLSIVIRMRLVIRQSKLPACLAEVQLAHQSISHSLVKMTDKMDEICINGKFSAQVPSEWRDFSIPVSNFTVFQPRIQTDSSSVGRSSQVVLKLIRSRIWQLSHSCQTWVWEYFPSSLALK